jgi:hypothetical protein
MKAAALIGTLYVSLDSILLFLYYFTPAQTHHVIFEEIGEMAGALSYIHVIIPINISGLLSALDDFRNKVVVLKSNYTDNKRYANRLDQYGGVNSNDPAKHALFHFRQQLSGLMDLMITDADNLQGSVKSL